MEIYVARNPYGFVPFPLSVQRRPLTPVNSGGHDRYRRDLFSGTFDCRLRTRTLLCIKALFEKLHGGEAYIPGSTLRGAVRSVAQALGAGCAALVELEGVEVPKKLQPCKDDRACLVCRVFGYAPKKAEQSWAGKVRFHSTLPIPVDWQNPAVSPVPRPKAKPPHFLEEDPAQLAGWRVFRHARQVSPVGGQIWCVPPEQVFSFRVDFQNLDAEELTVLRFALSLRHECAAHNHRIQLCHKIGYAKASGLGSCQIALTGDPAPYLGCKTNPLPATGCEIETYFTLPGWAKLRELLDFETAPQTLLRPGSWLQAHNNASIADFEAQHGDRITIP